MQRQKKQIDEQTQCLVLKAIKNLLLLLLHYFYLKLKKFIFIDNVSQLYATQEVVVQASLRFNTY
jgi:hypothetical protein